ncbi:MAG TPA: hypothetical protein VEL11_14240 [Candidatus Bathyarchaeia archaeon]|nr:hypothetical protein [Candidatus Bathyarchaeia archaeon]
MKSNTGLALSVIGIAAVLMLVLAPIAANHQTFGYTYRYHGPLPHYKYFSGYGHKRCFARGGHIFCLVK